MNTKYSASTLITLHQRAVNYLEMIVYAERMIGVNLKDAENYSKKEHFFFQHIGTIQHHIREAWRCRRIANYLKKRYANLITKINQ